MCLPVACAHVESMFPPLFRPRCDSLRQPTMRPLREKTSAVLVKAGGMILSNLSWRVVLRKPSCDLSRPIPCVHILVISRGSGGNGYHPHSIYPMRRLVRQCVRFLLRPLDRLSFTGRYLEDALCEGFPHPIPSPLSRTRVCGRTGVLERRILRELPM